MSEPGFMGIASAAASFACFVVAHILGLRNRQENAAWLVRSYGATLILCVAAAAGWAAAQALPVAGVALAAGIGLLTNACLFVLYVPAVYVVLTSLSVQTIVLLRQSGGYLPEAALYRRFGGQEILPGRLETLAANGYLLGAGGEYRLSPRGSKVAASFRAIKNLWCLGVGG